MKDETGLEIGSEEWNKRIKLALHSMSSETVHSNTEILQSFLDVLNEGLECDANAMHSLIVNRVPCNMKLADHPTIEVSKNGVLAGNNFTVGLLGVINGILERITRRKITFRFEEHEGKARLADFIENEEIRCK